MLTEVLAKIDQEMEDQGIMQQYESRLSGGQGEGVVNRFREARLKEAPSAKVAEKVSAKGSKGAAHRGDRGRGSACSEAPDAGRWIRRQRSSKGLLDLLRRSLSQALG